MFTSCPSAVTLTLEEQGDTITVDSNSGHITAASVTPGWNRYCIQPCLTKIKAQFYTNALELYSERVNAGLEEISVKNNLHLPSK